MNLSDIPLFKAMAQKMGFLGQRQQVLSQNVANADTPGYRPHDLATPSFQELVSGGGTPHPLGLAATQAKHIAPATASGGFKEVVDRKAQASPTGNAVRLETEMLKVSSTASDYALTTNLYRQHLAMLKTVLGRSA